MENENVKQITVDQIKEFGVPITEKDLNHIIVKVPENGFLITGKDGKKYVYDGSEVFYYSDGKNLFIQTISQDFEEFKTLIGG